jgi:hypothetical protein
MTQRQGPRTGTSLTYLLYLTFSFVNLTRRAERAYLCRLVSSALEFSAVEAEAVEVRVPEPQSGLRRVEAPSGPRASSEGKASVPLPRTAGLQLLTGTLVRKIRTSQYAINE